jgi:hypothetical protein
MMFEVQQSTPNLVLFELVNSAWPVYSRCASYKKISIVQRLRTGVVRVYACAF